MLNYFDDGLVDYADWCENIPIEWPAFRIEPGEEDDISTVTVYPNPAKDEFQISYYGLMENSMLDIIDISGKTILSVRLKDTMGVETVSVFNLVNGIYFCRVQNKEGDFVNKKLTVVK